MMSKSTRAAALITAGLTVLTFSGCDTSKPVNETGSLKSDSAERVTTKETNKGDSTEATTAVEKKAYETYSYARNEVDATTSIDKVTNFNVATNIDAADIINAIIMAKATAERGAAFRDPDSDNYAFFLEHLTVNGQSVEKFTSMNIGGGWAVLAVNAAGDADVYTSSYKSSDISYKALLDTIDYFNSSDEVYIDDKTINPAITKPVLDAMGVKNADFISYDHKNGPWGSEDSIIACNFNIPLMKDSEIVLNSKDFAAQYPQPTNEQVKNFTPVE
jgi:hypothetical protein